MGSGADFYIDNGPYAKWIGSAYEDGELWKIPANILNQDDDILYEIAVIEYLQSVKSTIKELGGSWPWFWSDSRLTEYAYIFIPELKRVVLSVQGSYLVDPLIIIQGEDMETASLGVKPIFPIMMPPTKAKTEELIKKYAE